MTLSISRRTVLKGVGCTLGLPLLEAMLPSRGFAASQAKPPVRMAFVTVPNGIIMDAFRPKDAGDKFDLPPTLEPFANLRKEITVITGLAQDNGRSHGDGAGDHARSSASLLTGAHPVKTSGANIRVGQSVDQAAAERVGHLTRLPSLEIGIDRGRDAGSCDSGYSCAYSNSVSWKDATTPMAKEINPRLVFERMFGKSNKDEASLARRNRVRQSVLDLVSEQAADLKNQLGKTDQQKVEQYFSSVREIELRITRASETAEAPPPDFAVPSGVPGDFVEHIRLMYDLLALAFQTDTTRIATFMVANEGSNRSYRNVGVNSGHHELSHHQRDEKKIEQLQKIDLFLMGEFARFVGKLRGISEGSGTLLDHCMVMYGSGISDGNRHRHDDLPIVLAGRGGGTIRAGRHIRIDRETPLNNLFLSMLDRMSASVPTLGDSTDRLTAIDA